MSLYKNILQSDKFLISNKSNSLIELLLKISDKKMSYPYNKIKKFICKEQDLPVDKKTLDNINLSKIDINYIFRYFNYNVIYYETEFRYYDNQNKYTILIFHDDTTFLNFKIEEKQKWKSEELPHELSLLTSQTEYILNILKTIVHKYNLCRNKLTIVEIIYLVEKHYKKLSSTESKLVYNLINPLIGLDCFIYT
jgi:hypothetical protein